MNEPLRQLRVDRLQALRGNGIDPYPSQVEQSHFIGTIVSRYADAAQDEIDDKQVAIVGRLVAFRDMGRASFFDLRDGSGTIQVHVSRDNLGKQSYETLLDADIGDFLSVRGKLFRTRRGELTVEVDRWIPISKSLRPLPEKWHGLRDTELRYRHRSLDLISNESVRETFVVRSKMLAALRRFLNERRFLEVETPMMQTLPGGATARPFVTHHNALGIDLYMRIAPELYLKRLIVGGLDRVYELGKSFRNEGVSSEHNPEFTTLELYQAYTDYEGIMALTEQMISDVAAEVLGTTKISYQGATIDLSPPWKRVSMLESVESKVSVPVIGCSAEKIRGSARTREIDLPDLPRGKLIGYLFERFVEPTICQPTFVVDFPLDISPLAKKKPGNEDTVERFEVFIGGLELGNAFTELNDPVDQRKRFEQQEAWREKGDDEAQRVDEDFLFALEHGMPPTGGLGIGIDRLTMLFTDCASIRDVILFPTLKRKERR